MKEKGQEEIVGFILIIVLVAIALVIVLSFSIGRAKVEVRDSSDIYQFLESTMELTTNCSMASSKDYASLKETIGACYEEKNCFGGEYSCDVIKTELKNLLNASWPIKEEGRIEGYIWESVYAKNDSRKTFLNVSEGKCGSVRRGASYPLPIQSGRIENGFIVCFSNLKPNNQV